MVRRSPMQSRGNKRYRRQPIQEQRGARVSRERLMPPPVGGWNARDALSMMRPEDAVFMRNMFPQQANVIARPGFSQHCDTTGSSAVEQLIPYEYGAAANLFAASGGTIYDVSTATPSTPTGGTGYSNNDWSFDYITGYIIMANGVDSLTEYTGSQFQTSSFTGVTLTNLNQVHVYKSRVYLVEKNSQSMWYGGTGAVAGALTEFDFSSVAPVKGNLIFTTHLKGDGGDGGNDDMFIAVFAAGDVLAYSGSNPSDPTDWALVGHYRIGRPLSRLSFLAAQDDVYIITDRGYEEMSRVMSTGSSTRQVALLSDKIQLAVTDQIKTYGENIDWRVVMHQKGQMLIFTVPSSSRRYHVQNINTKAWCEFLDFSANCWAVWQGDLYFGAAGDGIIYEFNDGSVSDAGVSIRADCQQAWSDMGYSSRVKRVNLLKPFIFSDYKPNLSINVGADYNNIPLAVFEGTATSSTQAEWDTAVWDTDTWSTALENQSTWHSKNAIGTVIGLRFTFDVETSGQRPQWNNTSIIFEVGGYL